MDNMITFLIAGHETTSGLLSFAFYYLLRNPEVYQKAQQEVDNVIGKGSVTVDHLSKVPYLTAVLRETLRLQPTAPAINMTAKDDTTLGGKYAVKAGQPIICLFPMVGRYHHPAFTQKREQPLTSPLDSSGSSRIWRGRRRVPPREDARRGV